MGVLPCGPAPGIGGIPDVMEDGGGGGGAEDADAACAVGGVSANSW